MRKQFSNGEIRNTLRLPDYDYSSSGAYSVTICTRPRRPIFDRPELRAILEKFWWAIPELHKGTQLDVFVIMSDHIHFIIWLDQEISGGTKLGDVIGAYKSLTAVAWIKYISANGLNERAKFWQRNYMEHIIRSDFELKQRYDYIENNSAKAEMMREFEQREMELRRMRKLRGTFTA